jgi:hypothetical protein
MVAAENIKITKENRTVARENREKAISKIVISYII